MKIAVLVLGILLTLLGIVAVVVCLLLPTLTSNRVSFDEALLGLIPSVLVLLFGLLLSVIGAILLFLGRKSGK